MFNIIIEHIFLSKFLPNRVWNKPVIIRKFIEQFDSFTALFVNQPIVIELE